MSKHKAAILAFCNTDGLVNYGQVLQCYASYRLLASYGYFAVLVDYRRRAGREPKTRRVRNFLDFMDKFIPLSRPCGNVREVEAETRDCGLLVCGSGQVWSPAFIDEVWTLGFGGEGKARIALAASGLFADDTFTAEGLARYADTIGRMDYISVREDCARDILGRFVKKNISVLSDPALLLSAGEWDAVTGDARAEGDYVFCYCLGSIRAYPLILREVSRLYGNAGVKYIPSNLVGEYGYGFMEAIHDAGPGEFLALVQNARAVVTDSFHGVVFSMIYGVDWYNVDCRAEGICCSGERECVDNLMQDFAPELGWIRNVRDVQKRYSIFREGVDRSRLDGRITQSKQELGKVLGGCHANGQKAGVFDACEKR